NAEEFKKKTRDYANTPRGRQSIKRRRHRRRMAVKQVPSTFTFEQWGDCLSYFGNSCAYCRGTGTLHQEHFIPVSLGGEYTVQNIIPACEECNLKKQASNVFDWYPKQNAYSQRNMDAILKYLKYHD